MQRYILALDQGTTSSRAILFGRDGSVGGHAQRPFRQYYPHPGWVEHDPNEIWESERAVAAQALRESGLGRAVAAIGITNQRETTILWDRATGEPIHNAIVWQCRRTADIADALREKRGVSELVAEKTGLHIDAYFRDEDQVAARPRPQRAGKGRARRNFIRYGGDMAHLEADGRQGPRDGLLERQPHDALQHPHAFVG